MIGYSGGAVKKSSICGESSRRRGEGYVDDKARSAKLERFEVTVSGRPLTALGMADEVFSPMLEEGRY